MSFIKALSKGILIAAALVAVNIFAQVSFVEEIEPLQGITIYKSAPPEPAPESKLEMHSSKAELLYNPAPDYPPRSVKLGEQGQVSVSVLIGADGVPQKVELHTSSGFKRLDNAGMDAVMRWRYVPGKSGGIAEAMWFLQPITFNLKEDDEQ